MLRFLLVEAAQVTVRSQPRVAQSHSSTCAATRTEDREGRDGSESWPVHLYWMWRQRCDYSQWHKFGSHAGQPGNRDGVQ